MRDSIRRIWSEICFRTICKWFGHGEIIWRPPIFVPWYLEHVPLHPVLWSGQCERCWRVVKESQYVEIKGR
jgi:hypothetical protein